MKEVTIDGHTGDLMTVQEFNEACDSGLFVDSDGMGDLVINGGIVTPHALSDLAWPWIYPSIRDLIPANVTHVLWYNK